MKELIATAGHSEIINAELAVAQFNCSGAILGVPSNVIPKMERKMSFTGTLRLSRELTRSSVSTRKLTAIRNPCQAALDLAFGLRRQLGPQDTLRLSHPEYISS
jgi:hypothetical protein